ncbi:MAG: GNAT family N-acetyltransferase [Microthrixaceae bacterium]
MTILEANATVRELGLGLRRPPEIHRDYSPDHCAPHQILRAVTQDEVELWDQAERLVYKIYREMGFCEPSPRNWVEDFEQYRDGSTFYVVIDDDRVVGAIRTMVGPIGELPIGKFPLHTIDPSMVVCEFGSLAVEQEFRGLGITNALHRCAGQHTFRCGAEAFALAVEPWFLEVYRDLYGIPMVLISDPVHYMGSETLAGVVFLDHMISVFIKERPNVLKWLTDGLDPELWMPDTIDLRGL